MHGAAAQVLEVPHRGRADMRQLRLAGDPPPCFFWMCEREERAGDEARTQRSACEPGGWADCVRQTRMRERARPRCQSERDGQACARSLGASQAEGRQIHLREGALPAGVAHDAPEGRKGALWRGRTTMQRDVAVRRLNLAWWWWVHPRVASACGRVRSRRSRRLAGPRRSLRTTVAPIGCWRRTHMGQSAVSLARARKVGALARDGRAATCAGSAGSCCDEQQRPALVA